MAQKIQAYVPLLFLAFLLLSIPFIYLGGMQAKLSMALHTSGTNILDAYGNVVYLRGIGRSGDLQSASGMWSGPDETVFDWSQKWESISSNIPRMDSTFQTYRDYWRVNMIRILIPVDWWWLDIIYPKNYQTDAVNSDPISYRAYIETLVKEAARYGLYVDLCPYSAVNSYFYSGRSEGEPGTWRTGTASYQFIQNVTVNVGITESEFWKNWWTTIVKELGAYQNIIFEMWNEPGIAKDSFFNYLLSSYQTIRGSDNENLIFMQWQPGIVPQVNTLTWAPELYSRLQQTIEGSPLNLVFTTHPYRLSPYPNLQWAYTYSEVKQQLLESNMIPQTRSTGCKVPLLFNEIGVLDADHVYFDWPGVYEQFNQQDLTVDERRQIEYSFWDAILHNAKDLGIGVCAYYWMQNSAATNYGYGGEALISHSTWNEGSPAPNYAGQVFINYSLPQTSYFRPWQQLLR